MNLSWSTVDQKSRKLRRVLCKALSKGVVRLSSCGFIDKFHEIPQTFLQEQHSLFCTFDQSGLELYFHPLKTSNVLFFLEKIRDCFVVYCLAISGEGLACNLKCINYMFLS